MKATGIVRRMDELGRIVIPMEMRKLYGINDGDPLEIFTDNEGHRNINIVKSFCNPDDYSINLIVSRSTIRELSENTEWAWYENYLHAARMKVLMLGTEYDKALELINQNDILDIY